MGLSCCKPCSYMWSLGSSTQLAELGRARLQPAELHCCGSHLFRTTPQAGQRNTDSLPSASCFWVVSVDVQNLEIWVRSSHGTRCIPLDSSRLKFSLDVKKEHRWPRIRILPPNRPSSSDFTAAELNPTWMVACCYLKSRCRSIAKAK